MKNREDRNGIKCDIFLDKFKVLNRIKPKINRARNILDKAKYAEEVMGEVDSLLNCSRFDEHSTDCQNCQIVAGLHKRTADLIINAKSLA
ncbi:MAG: hypothetical protein ACEPOZ_19300 [Marinifilaceae bacterium]|jgi:conjugal transfer/entry exclusion protein